jgi:hypothetical protein
MQWCCKVFEGWFQQAGQRGLAVFASTEGSHPAFILQFRALSPGKSLSHTESPVSLVSDVQIQFCPWCGANLEKTYVKNIRDLDRSELRVRSGRAAGPSS